MCGVKDSKEQFWLQHTTVYLNAPYGRQQVVVCNAEGSAAQGSHEPVTEPFWSRSLTAMHGATHEAFRR